MASSIACICCGSAGKFSILLAQGPHGEEGREDPRYYVPNDAVRSQKPSPMKEVWFCGEHMRAVEDAVRATILYHQAENGMMLVKPQTS
jgi:hypothetical protein